MKGKVKNMVLVERLNELYRESGCKNQESFANILGVSRQTLGHWLNGERSPDADNLLAISNATGKTVDWLLGIDPIEKMTSDKEKQFVRDYTGLSERAIRNLRLFSSDGGEHDDRKKRIIHALNFHLENLSFYQILNYVALAIEADERRSKWGGPVSHEEITSMIDTGANAVDNDFYARLDPSAMVDFTCYTAVTEYTSFINDTIQTHIGEYDDGVRESITRHWFYQILGIEEV